MSEQIKNAERGDVFPHELNDILATPLVPESIDMYAEDALNRLIMFVGRVTQAYNTSPTMNFSNGLETETAAFSYYKLGNVEEILDHVNVKANEIHMLDSVMSRATKLDHVITPTDPDERSPLVAGNDSFEEKRTIPRTKTVLFILLNDFEVNVWDETELTVEEGIVDKNMMRKLSYSLITAHNLGKSILVCDEADNASYVFNTPILTQLGIDKDMLLAATKPELNALLENNSSAGIRIEYSQHFIDDMISALNGSDIAATQSNRKTRRGTIDSSYLYPRAPEDVASTADMVNFYEIGYHGLYKAIERLGDSLGTVGLYQVGNAKGVHCYNRNQQAMIDAELINSGAFLTPPPDDIVPIPVMADFYEVSYGAVSNAIKDLGEKLGSIGLYQVDRKWSVPCFNHEQRAMIDAELIRKGTFLPDAPENISSASMISVSLGVDYYKVTAAIDRLGDELGYVEEYKFSSRRAFGYDEQQAALIIARVAEEHPPAPPPPEGILSLFSIAKSTGKGYKFLMRAAAEVDDKLGEVGTYRYGNRVLPGYDQFQKEIILAAADALEVPEGGLSFNGIAETYGITRKTFNEMIENVEPEELGTVNTYAFRGRKSGAMYAQGYTIDQQILILKDIIVPAPLNVLDAGRTANTLGVNESQVKQATKELGKALGPVKLHKFGEVIAHGYDEPQRTIIETYIRSTSQKN